MTLARLREALIELANTWFPERQILVRGPHHTSAIHISQRKQLVAAGATTAAILWGLASTLVVVSSWEAKAMGAFSVARLQAELTYSQAHVLAMQAENAAMAQARNAAIAQATAAQIAANLQTAQIAASSSQQVGALDQQTQAAISHVQTILRATGLNPDRLAHATPAVPPSTPDNAELLQHDLGHLQALGNLLAQVPLASPVASMSISSPFGYRPDPWTGIREFHVGIDLTGPIGTPIHATAPGTVTFAGVQTGYGEIVIVDHGYGLSTRYSHLNKILVHAGQPVALHETVGLMGNTGWSTGPHLLYETRLDGEPENPLNFIKVSENDVQE